MIFVRHFGSNGSIALLELPFPVQIAIFEALSGCPAAVLQPDASDEWLYQQP